MKIERAFTDQSFFPFLICHVSNGNHLLLDTCQIKWHQCLYKTEKDHKITIFVSVSEVCDKLSGFSRPKLKFQALIRKLDQIEDLNKRWLFVYTVTLKMDQNRKTFSSPGIARKLSSTRKS